MNWLQPNPFKKNGEVVYVQFRKRKLTGRVVPLRQWVHKRTGAVADRDEVPWTGFPGNLQEDWRAKTVGWEIIWSDGIERPLLFKTKRAAEAWLEGQS